MVRRCWDSCWARWDRLVLRLIDECFMTVIEVTDRCEKLGWLKKRDGQ